MPQAEDAEEETRSVNLVTISSFPITAWQIASNTTTYQALSCTPMFTQIGWPKDVGQNTKLFGIQVIVPQRF